MRTSNADACPLMRRMHGPRREPTADLLGVRLQRQRVGTLSDRCGGALDQLVLDCLIRRRGSRQREFLDGDRGERATSGLLPKTKHQTLHDLFQPLNLSASERLRWTDWRLPRHRAVAFRGGELSDLLQNVRLNKVRSGRLLPVACGALENRQDEVRESRKRLTALPVSQPPVVCGANDICHQKGRRSDWVRTATYDRGGDPHD